MQQHARNAVAEALLQRRSHQWQVIAVAHVDLEARAGAELRRQPGRALACGLQQGIEVDEGFLDLRQQFAHVLRGMPDHAGRA